MSVTIDPRGFNSPIHKREKHTAQILNLTEMPSLDLRAVALSRRPQVHDFPGMLFVQRVHKVKVRLTTQAAQEEICPRRARR